MKVYADWYPAEVGQVFAVKITTDTGRILAVARVEVPLQPGYTLEERIGADAVREIEAQIRRAAEAVAHGVQTPPRS